VNCRSCQQANPDDARFCNGCGAPLEVEVTCGGCQRVNPAGSRFCNGCGGPLGAAAPGEPASGPPAPGSLAYTPPHLAAKILHNKAALEGERKHVTVLFADLADSTAIAAQIGPDEMHALMDDAFKPILTEVHRYEGTVNQFTGDGVMALFGAPVAVEDAPRGAVLAALGIQDALKAFEKRVLARTGYAFRMRIGIHSGPVVVGRIGDDLRMDYTAIGDTTNLASRLEQLAPPGGVVISTTTRRLVEGFFDLEALEPTHVKGIVDPVVAHRVLGARDVSGRMEAQSDFTRYVGRKQELQALQAALDSAGASRGRVCFVVGEAGIGKSRLLYEFRSQLQDDAHVWFEGRCASFAKTTAFHCIADGLRRLIGIDDRDDEPAAVEKVAAYERSLGGGLEWTGPFVRRLLSLPTGDPEVDAMDAMSRRSETCRALLALFTRMSESQPLVFVIEDLHWIDPASEEFLGFLADSIPAARVLLLLTHRPGYQQPFGDRSFHVRVPVQALSEEAMSQMVASVLETSELPPALDLLIASKAEGNPLFVEEVVRSLLEEGVIRIEEGRLRLERDLRQVSVPDRIQDVLMARLDRLPEAPKRAIQIASVIGREFAMRLLERITETGEHIDGIVGELRALELIYEKASHPELAYMFKHALTHDVAYDSVLLKRRKALHRIVGSAIEELYRDRLAEHYEALAHHFGEAEEWERALLYHELASEKSASTYANHSAADHCRAALAIADRLADEVPAARRAAISLRLAACCWSLSEFGESAEHYSQAAAAAETDSERAMALARAGLSALWAHDYVRCTELGTEARELAEQVGDDGAHAVALVVNDELELVHGRDLDDLWRAEEAIRLAEQSGKPPVIVQAYSHFAQRAEWHGDFRRAISYGEKAVALAEREHIPGDALFGQWFLGMAYVCMGEYGRGSSVLGEGLELSDRIGDRAVRARLLNTVGWCYAEFGAYERAVEFNRMGTQLAEQMVDLGLVPGAPELLANAAINLAGNFTALGDFDAAEELLDRVQQMTAHDEDPWQRWRYTPHLRHGQARLALARGQVDAAYELSLAEVGAARDALAQKIEARSLEFHSRVLLAQERTGEAKTVAGQALELARRIEHPPVAWRAFAMLGEMARRAGDSEEAELQLGKARRLVEEKARTVADSDLRRQFRAMGEQLVRDAPAAYR
jgi:class 3 adenylate cyclase